MAGWAFRAAAAASAAICIAFSVWLSLRFGGKTATTVVDDVLMTVTPAMAGVACWWRALTQDAGRRERNFWLLWGGSYLAFAAGMLVWDHAQLFRDVELPYPSYGDIGFLGAVALNGAALFFSPRAGERAWMTVRGFLDGLILTSALFFSVWHLVLDRIVSASNASTLAKAVGIAYATGYLTVLVAIVLQAASSPRRASWGLRLLTASLVLLTAVNFPYALMCIDGSYHTGSPIDVLWIGAFCLGTLAAIAPERGREIVKPAPPPRWIAFVQLGLPYVAVFVAGAIAFGMMITGQRFSGVISWTAGLLVTLVLLRQYLALVDVRQRTLALTEANVHILEADRAKSQFLAAMSHELRTPLNSIIGFSEILDTRLGDKLGEPHARFVKHIHSSGTHLLRLINDILDLSKIESGKMNFDPELIESRPFCEGVLAIARGVAGTRGIKLGLEAPEGLPPFEGDPIRVKQVLYNLLANAVKFSPEGSTVTLGVRAVAPSEPPLHAEAIEFRVTDHGIGIAPEHHALIFEEFKQVDEAARGKGGTGLGLALVRKLVALHGGSVALHSRLGQGATFVVTLPRKALGKTQ